MEKEIKYLKQMIFALEKRVEYLEKRTIGPNNYKCEHATYPFGPNKRKCGICGEIFITN